MYFFMYETVKIKKKLKELFIFFLFKSGKCF